ncbi:hypothetical protein H0O00_05495 [Candidatus Micrarchaeota archaeon]|nr:hypothetical protein [Candidatus Micrarchaeota archaeon]
MKVFPELTKTTWGVLFFLAKKNALPSETARSIGIPLSKVSVCVSSLTAAKILKPRKGYELLSLDASLRHSIGVFLQDYPESRLARLFYGARLNVLFQISEGYTTLAKLRAITNCPGITLRRILKQLQDALLIYQPKRGIYEPRDAFRDKVPSLKSVFLALYFESLKAQGLAWKRVLVFGDTILIKTEQENPPGFVQTGFSRFHEYRVGLIMTKDNYFVNSSREPTKQEVFVHALAFSVNDARYLLYCTLFADLNRLTLNELKDLPAVYKVEKEAALVFESIKAKSQEYSVLRREYARS